MVDRDEHGMQRRVAGVHDIRMDGMTDLVMRARGKSVFDIGCNRGMVGVEFAMNGARLVHGCDNSDEVIQVARHIFADIRYCRSRFECIDLAQGSDALGVFGEGQYDFVIMLATYHKLKRVMSEADLTRLTRHFGHWTRRYFAWRATSDKPKENDDEMQALDRDLGTCGLQRIHTSYISHELGVAAIWERR